jgi:hypothetical protein
MPAWAGGLQITHSPCDQSLALRVPSGKEGENFMYVPVGLIILILIIFFLLYR